MAKEQTEINRIQHFLVDQGYGELEQIRPEADQWGQYTAAAWREAVMAAYQGKPGYRVLLRQPQALAPEVELAMTEAAESYHARRADPEAEQADEGEEPEHTLESLQRLRKDDLMALADEEEVDFEESDTKAQIATKILDKRNSN